MTALQRVALVTGASGGIGAAIAFELARRGAFVLATSREAERCASVCAEIAEAGGAAAALELDVADGRSIATLGERIRESEAPGPVGWLVNNAGIAESAPFLGASQEAADALAARHLDVNYHGPRRLMQVFAPAMVAAGYGRVVNVASSAGLRGYAYVADYCASKHALVGLTRSAALELGGRGVFVSAVCPHYVDTPMTTESIRRVVEKTGKSEEEARRFFERQNPGGRLVSAYEVAVAAADLCEGEENGAIVELDGSDSEV